MHEILEKIKMDELTKHWDNLQKIGVSGSTPNNRVWDYLKVNDLISQGKVILNIGLGAGAESKELHEKGCTIYALDISPLKLEVVKPYTMARYLPSELDKLPENTFDLTTSHLVTQHMSDEDLLEQMKAVIKGLKKDGIFAMQFADSELEHYHINQDIERQKSGSICRSMEKMKRMIKEANGKIVWITNEQRFFPEYQTKWHAIHIIKCEEK